MQGKDLVMSKDSQEIWIEAKGKTSARETSSRFGLGFNDAQCHDHFSRAFFKACEMRDEAKRSGKNVRIAMAFAHTKHYQKYCNRTNGTRKELGIGLFWITENGIVEEPLFLNPNGIQSSAQGWRAATTLGNRFPNSSTLKELNQIHRRTDTTPSELFVIQSLTRRSPIASANAGLNDLTPLELVCCAAAPQVWRTSRFALPLRALKIGCIAEADLLRQWHIGFPS